MFTVLMVAALLQAAAPAAPPESPPLITSPDWIRRPAGEDMARVYPPEAVRKNRSGRATISCVVDATGKVGDCKVLEEFPVGEGFGDAALKLASNFRMRPVTKDGKPVAGGIVKVPISFRVLPGVPDTLTIVSECYGTTAAALQKDPANDELRRATFTFAAHVALREAQAGAMPETFETLLTFARRQEEGADDKGRPDLLNPCLKIFRDSGKP